MNRSQILRFFFYKFPDISATTQPSPMICQLLYNELVSEPRNRQRCGRKHIRCKITLACIAGLTLTLICVATAGQLVVTQ